MLERFASFPLVFALAGAAALGACVDEPVLDPGTAGEGAVVAANGPSVRDRNLEVRVVAGGLTTPITMTFLGEDDILVLEKNTGQVKRITGGVVGGVVLDLAVNFGSERGLLGIALHPQFPSNPGVYLYWTESTTGTDTGVLSATPLLGNRVERYLWDGSALTFDRNLIRIRALQQDAGQPERGNHDGGVLKFGPDGKLYVFTGDLGRRGWMQNLRCGPTDTYDCPPGSPVADDQFGGPEPDDAHFSGVVRRLNDDGSTPADNPFFAAGAAVGGEAGRNIQRLFSYGHRNSFGMDFDPQTGGLWLQENGDDTFSEINLVSPGMNGGWIQFMGPRSRIGQFKEIETSTQFFGLQQVRWPPTNIADSEAEAMSRLYLLPGAHYSDPEFAWKYEVSPGGIGFIDGGALGPQYDGRLIIGGARDFLLDGHLFQLQLTGNRTKIGVDDPRLEDRVADNLDKWEITESESLLFGTGFGVVTDVRTGPNGNLFLVSLSHGSVYEIARRQH